MNEVSRSNIKVVELPDLPEYLKELGGRSSKMRDRGYSVPDSPFANGRMGEIRRMREVRFVDFENASSQLTLTDRMVRFGRELLNNLLY